MLDIKRLPLPINKSNYSLWAGSEDEMHRVASAQDFLVAYRTPDGQWCKVATHGFNEMEFLQTQIQTMKEASVPPLPAIPIKNMPKVEPKAPAKTTAAPRSYEVPE